MRKVDVERRLVGSEGWHPKGRAPARTDKMEAGSYSREQEEGMRKSRWDMHTQELSRPLISSDLPQGYSAWSESAGDGSNV